MTKAITLDNAGWIDSHIPHIDGYHQTLCGLTTGDAVSGAKKTNTVTCEDCKQFYELVTKFRNEDMI